jgi:hypothetical protein
MGLLQPTLIIFGELRSPIITVQAPFDGIVEVRLNCLRVYISPKAEWLYSNPKRNDKSAFNIEADIVWNSSPESPHNPKKMDGLHFFTSLLRRKCSGQVS